MRKPSEPSFILAARQRLAGYNKRVDRQRRRVERIRKEGRTSPRATALLDFFLRKQQRPEQLLRGMIRWSLKNPGKKRFKYSRRSTAKLPKEEKTARWDREVRDFLEQQYPDAPNYRGSLLALWEKYLTLGLPNQHFVSEFTSGKKAVVFQRSWEMMLARHLDACGHKLTTADEGPDFRFDHDGLTVWVEAVSPEPEGVPDHWLEKLKPGEFKVGDVPHSEVLLRWTAALKAKWDKLNAYRKKEIVRENDAYVIAINGCQLGAFALNHGVSRLPYAVEAVYGLGPVTIPIDRETGKFGQAFVSHRTEVKNAKGASVPTSLFIDPAFSGISAIIACSLDRSTDVELPVDIVHNQLASTPVPERILGNVGEEWVARESDDGGKELERLENLNGPS